MFRRRRFGKRWRRQRQGAALTARSHARTHAASAQLLSDRGGAVASLAPPHARRLRRAVRTPARLLCASRGDAVVRPSSLVKFPSSHLAVAHPSLAPARYYLIVETKWRGSWLRLPTLANNRRHASVNLLWRCTKIFRICGSIESAPNSDSRCMFFFSPFLFAHALCVCDLCIYVAVLHSV